DVIMPMKERLMRALLLYQQHLWVGYLSPSLRSAYLASAHDNAALFPHLKHAQDLITARSTGASVAPAPRRAGQYLYLVTITNPDVYFVESPSRPDALALVLHTTCIVRYVSSEAACKSVFSIDYRHSEIYKCQL